MGAKDSKLTYITYEEAIKRVTPIELQRLKDAFKRSSIPNGYMTKTVFIREVLGDGVPPRLAEQIYTAFGGTTKGLGFKDLLCGLVLLTKGQQEEKVKFVFGLYANEALTHVQKEEMDRIVLATERQVPQALSQLFLDVSRPQQKTDRVTYEQFRAWVLRNRDATSVTRWLLQDAPTVSLSNNQETPTFYQTLAGVTHLEETDIIELEKRYWSLKAQSKTGRFDLDTFRPIICPPVPESLCEGVFFAFDENRDNHIDFKEMACGISACCRGPMTERQKFCFKIFDKDHDGLLSKQELLNMICAMMEVRLENKPPDELSSDGLNELDPAKLAEEILEAHDNDKDGFITQEEYLVWTVNHPLPSVFLQLLFQVCHVVLGLKPQSKEEEGKVICGWLDREDRRGLRMGQVWYLISMHWWNSWLDYVNLRPITVPYGEDASSLMRMENGRKTSATSRASALCRGRKPSVGFDDTSSNSYSLSASSSENFNASPMKYATLPRTNSPSLNSGSPSPSASPRHSLTVDLSQSPAHSRNTTPSPSASPKLGRRMPGVAQRPCAIDNTPLVLPNTQKVTVLTNEGGRLKRDKMLARGRDFELVPEPVWKALSSWYGGTPALPRTVITPRHGEPPELELYPIGVRLLRHQNQQQRPNQPTSFTGMIGGMGGIAVTAAGLAGNQPQPPRRYMAYVASFSRKHTLRQVYEFLTMRLRISREDMRLWKFKDETNMQLLEEEELTMEELNVEENMQLLIEVRNKDLTWPEEMSQLAKNKAAVDKTKQVATERGATGLNNLGNTCFMNSALQCVSNTRILTLYFTGGMHLYELNRHNPLGMKGHIAQRYGELVKDLWSGTAKAVAPLKFRWTIGKYAPRFNGFQQHDSQELLAFLLDGLHEDLNRVHNKPYVELKDSDGRPDEEVAKEAWENHLLRNRSVVVDLFHGQLKSCVRCLECGHTSVRFDPFTYLSLPLPMDSCIPVEVIVMKLNGSVPVKYGIRLNMDEKYKDLKKHLGDLSSIPPAQLLLTEIGGAVVKNFMQDHSKIKSLIGGSLYAYELPPEPEIQPMTAEEEKMGSTQPSPKVQGGLSQIQRMARHNQLQRDMLPSAPNNNNNGTNSGASTPQRNNSSNSLANGLANGSSTSPSPIGTPNHQRTDSSLSTASSTNGATVGAETPNMRGFVVALHRKMIRMDVYFLSSQKSRPSLFGTPLILPCDDQTTNQKLYELVWTQVSRLVSPLPPSESGTPNHAQDCDDSMGYEYPFALKVVQREGFMCAWCPWFRFCRGCKLNCNQEMFNYGSSYLAVDWEPTALHLRYQTSQERVYQEHWSVEESRRLQTEPIDLDACLRAFTKEEELGEDELYYCSKCKKHCLAAKKLDIWRLPPILIIHLKRFQFLNGRWVKSQKIVRFPVKDFDPTHYLVPREPRAIDCNGATNHDTHAGTHSPGKARKMNGQAVLIREGPCEDLSNSPRSNPAMVNGIESDEDDETFSTDQSIMDREKAKLRRNKRSLTSEYHEDYTNVRYDLYSMSCHTGILGGGHYVAFGKNPNDKWYCYNDSSCKETSQKQVDMNSAYILFYERRNLDYSKFMPDITGREPDTADIDDEFESDFRKMCSIQ